MKKLFILLLILSINCVKTTAQKNGLFYPALLIPKELSSDANAVVRMHEQTFEVLSVGKSKSHHKTAITILNKEGDHHAYLTVHYSEGMSRVEGLQAKVYNGLGVEIESAKKKDIVDISAYDGYSIASDNRLKVIDLRKSSYPYTIYYEYTTVDNNTMFYPSWYAQNSLNTAVEKSRYQVSIPQGMKLFYKEVNLPKPASRNSINGNSVFTWEIKNLKPLKSEPYSSVFEELAPRVLLRPDRFEVDGYEGSFDTWENMGNWINLLNKGKDDLPAETIAEIKKITSKASTQKEKVKLVYEYLQQNTRYVSIQLGIGGWQPFSASYVDKNSYGDCKALSNYMQTALKAIDIASYYTLVRAGSGKNIDKSFPASQFNHAFLCVPLAQDTIWLECTSQTNPFNYLGQFTSDRDVLLCTPEGGKVVHTPVYDKEDNLQARSGEVVIDEDGNATAKIKELRRAMQQDRVQGYATESEEDQKKFLYNYIDIPSFNIKSFELNWEKSELPTFSVESELSIPNCASTSGKRLFLKPNLLTKWTDVPKKLEERKSSIKLDMAFTDIDTIIYQIPEKYHLEYLPKPVSVSSVFGTYESKIEFKNHQLIYTRKMVMEKGEFPKEQYEEFVSFFKKIKKADRAKTVFVDKT